MAYRIPASIFNRSEAAAQPISGGMAPGNAPTRTHTDVFRFSGVYTNRYVSNVTVASTLASGLTEGLPSDRGSKPGGQVREFLRRAVEALVGLPEASATAVKQEGLAPEGKYLAFIAVLDRNSRDSLAAIELVLAQPAISFQLIDNLNPSTHLRALLTDLFLLGEILRKRSNLQ